LRLLSFYLVVDVPINPEIRPYLAIGVSVAAPPVPDVVLELSLVDLTVFPGELAPSVFEVVGVGALEDISVV
jgi:hypothetical protein